MKVTTAEFLKNFGTLADKALAEPLTITKHGRDRFVLVEAAEYDRLERRSRKVVPLEAFTDAEMELIEASLEGYGDAHLDAEVKDWKP
jgi:prevent-host-death family protein